MNQVSTRPIVLNSLWQLVMHPSTLISLSMILLFPGLCVGQTWIRYVDQTDRFTVNFPGEPVVEEVDFLSEYGVVFPARAYTADAPPGRYSVTVVNFTETERDEVINYDEDMKGNTRATVESYVWSSATTPTPFSKMYSIEISEAEPPKPITSGFMGAGVAGAIAGLILIGFIADHKRGN